MAGFDDIETARYLSPALTTVRVDRFELGARALRRLLHVARLKDRNGGHTHEVLPTALVIRRSCGAELAPRAARWTNPSSEQGQAGLLKRRAAAAPPKSGVAAGAGPAAGRRKPQPKRARRVHARHRLDLRVCNPRLLQSREECRQAVGVQRVGRLP